jgi:hypothetical protein
MGMLLESALEAGTYHDIINYTINAAFEEQQFLKVLNQLIQRHEALRTGFIEDGENGYLAFAVSEIDPHYEFITTAISEEELIKKEQAKTFDFATPGLFRFVISNVTSNSFMLLFSFHHAIIDGWSEAALIAELCSRYTGEIDSEVHLTELPGYGEYVRNEKSTLNDARFMEFWSNYLSGFELPAIPFLKESTSNKAGMEEPSYMLSDEESLAVLEISKKLGITVDTVFIAVYHHTLKLFQDTEDVMLGIVVNNRLEKEGGDQMCGLFLNAIPFRPSSLSSDVKVDFTVRHFQSLEGEDLTAFIQLTVWVIVLSSIIFVEKIITSRYSVWGSWCARRPW